MSDRQEAMVCLYFNIIMVTIANDEYKSWFCGLSIVALIVFFVEIFIEKVSRE